jgi:SAM-dependent methyltransferase
MAAVSGDYFIGVHDRELERLRDQHAAWLPETEALWRDAGFNAGQHVADLGCGPGFASMDLAGKVARVSAIDKASHFLEFLQQCKPSNVVTVSADITRDALAGPFDGAFCRWFLAFLVADLDPVLARIHAALKPGASLAAMEYLNLEATTSSPPMRGFDAHTRAWIDFYRANGGDTAIGRYLPQRLERAGFRIVSMRSIGGLALAGEPKWRWWGRLFADFGKTLVGSGLMDREALAQLESDWAAAPPGSFIHTPLLLQVVAARR